MYITRFHTKVMQIDKSKISLDIEVIKMVESQKLLGVQCINR